MWRKRCSALFIDFENVGTKATAASLGAMTAWLEDGKFDEMGGKRKLVSKRVYWNSAAERYRDLFEDAGFEVVLCEKFTSMKNGADIMMALDVLDACWKAPEIQEYILFTADSDFVPVLRRLSAKEKLSTVIVDETKIQAHTAFKIYADLVVPKRELDKEGFTYTRPKNILLKMLGRNGRGNHPPSAVSATAPSKTPSEGKGPAGQELLAQAERAVLRVASRTPKKFVPRKTIESELKKIREFTKTGPSAYLGKGHYQGLMMEIGRMNKRIRVQPQPGRRLGASVLYVPDDE